MKCGTVGTLNLFPSSEKESYNHPLSTSRYTGEIVTTNVDTNQNNETQDNRQDH